MAIFNKDELNESIDLFNKCADYVEGCLNETYEIDIDLLKESANYCLDILDEASKEEKAERRLNKHFSRHPDEKEKFDNITNYWQNYSKEQKEAQEKILDEKRKKEAIIRLQKELLNNLNGN